ncbi:MAG: HAD-superfamily hydrolase, subfamily [Nocardioides sp.]|nr:HAD-superfamily hydrolase, subfamily [Nocardioides sp.]
MLGSSVGTLCTDYDLAMLDLDGVVYVGGAAVPGAPDHLAAARESGMRLAFVTNNASRTPRRVAEHLRELGVPATEHDVVTSAQAAARALVERLGAGARVAVLGAPALADAVADQGLQPVAADEDAAALVSGYGPDVLWRDVMRAAVRVREGLWWVASNADLTIPTAYGVAPGHGVLVDTLRRFTGVEPVVAGKPQRPLLDETRRRLDGKRPLMVGDRLDTDIEGARNADVDSLLVLTGVTGLGELVIAQRDQRPTYVAPDLAGLAEVHEAPVERDGAFALAGWRAQVAGGRLEVAGSGPVEAWWRVVAQAAWHYLDDAGKPVEVAGLVAPTR